MNCPSQRGARTLTFLIPGFNTTVASLELWEGEGLKPREWRLRPQIVSQKFYNSRTSAKQTWVCLDLFTQDDSVSRLLFSLSTADLGCTSTGFTQDQIVCLYTNEPPPRSLLRSQDFVSILEESPSLWERYAFSGPMQVLASSADDMEALGLALF